MLSMLMSLSSVSDCWDAEESAAEDRAADMDGEGDEGMTVGGSTSGGKGDKGEGGRYGGKHGGGWYDVGKGGYYGQNRQFQRFFNFATSTTRT